MKGLGLQFPSCVSYSASWAFIGSLMVLFRLGNTQSWPCGLVDFDPNETIEIPIVQDFWPAREEIWRTKTFGIYNTSAIPHAHVKYISALNYPPPTNEYAFRLKDAFKDFYLEQQGVSTITRTVRFFCTIDGPSLEYQFEIPVNFTDLVEPVFQKSEYTFSINENEVWSLSKPINQNTVIIAYDDDIGMETGDLTFSTTNQTRCSSGSVGADTSFRATGIPLWAGALPPPGNSFYYMVEIYMNEALSVGCYEFDLVVASRVQKGKARITLTIRGHPF